MKNLFFVVVITLLGGQFAKSQTTGYELGPWIGAMNYFGDLNQDYDLTHPGPVLGIQARYVMNKRIAFSLRGAFGQLRGDDMWSDNAANRMRGLNFTTWLWDVTPQVEFNFLPFEHGSKYEYITPFVAIGGSFFRFNPKGTYDVPQPDGSFEEMTFELRNLGTEGQTLRTNELYSRIGLALNTTLGLRWYMGNNWTLQVFATARRTNTDYIDDVSTVYDVNALNRQYDVTSGSFRPEAYAIDPSFVSSGQSISNYGTRDGFARGDDKTMDTYATFGIGATYFFGICKCPTVNK